MHQIKTLAPITNEQMIEMLRFTPAAALLFDCNGSGSIIFANELAEKLLGYFNRELSGMAIQSLLRIPSEEYLAFIDSQSEQRFTVHDKNGNERRLDIRCSTMASSSNQSIMLAVLHDATGYELRLCEFQSLVTELEAVNSRLEDLVNTDPLTGLLNRRGLENILLREISFANRKGTKLLAALLDLDNFKSVNDNHGHHVGDRVLKKVAEILKGAVRAEDWVSRVGGDEFLVLLPATNLEGGVAVIERVRLKIAEQTGYASHDWRITGSIGLVSLPMHIHSLEEVLEQTKSSLKASKAAGKNRLFVENGSGLSDNSACQSRAILSGAGKLRAI